MNDLKLTVSEFVASLNQTFETAYPHITVVGELANFRVSKNRWVYFDLKDEFSTVKCFGTVYQLPAPLEDGMMLEVNGSPRMHPLYSFSFTIQNVQPVGEGSLKRAADLLTQKLLAEGLFDETRKRSLPFPPKRIGLITSAQSAAYADFIKILNERWGGLDIQLIDVLVQGEQAPAAITGAIRQFNEHAEPVDVLVITRGGGSPEDLWAFSTEQVTRAVAGSRIPTLVAIGHEVDLSLAELAADRRASTPSNAAQLLVPDRQETLVALGLSKEQLMQALSHYVVLLQQQLQQSMVRLNDAIEGLINRQRQYVTTRAQLLNALSPAAALERGYAIIEHNGKLLRSGRELTKGDMLTITLRDARLETELQRVTIVEKGKGHHGKES